MALVLPGIFYVDDGARPGYIIEFVFGGAGPDPDRAGRQGRLSTGIQWNYTTYLNIVFLLLAAVLLVRFFRSGGGPMLAMMGGGPDDTRPP